MISADLALELARRHEWARSEVKSIDPVTVEHPELDIDDAYAIQRAWVDLQVASGARLVGRKIGLTSRAMQQQMKIDEPDFGALLDYMIMESGVVLRHADYVDPKLEVEVAFMIGRRLSGESVSVEEVLAATAYIQPALELIDARSHRVHPVTGRARTVVDTIADNAADAGVILGGRQVDPSSIDMPWIGAIFSCNGVVEETGLAAGVLGHPANGIAWVARRLAPYGQAIEPGELILSGSFTRAAPTRPGDEFRADYGPLGTVSCSFI
ncbi:MAG TPA: 2-oxo-hepta-3-ene-1,7-dioic acid hydratase [Ilumatobacteraceae bacterium]|nr:2-oxo-hepta-3-ene-1,7-dioic acid hydratase [Ilumatobacteraceae bacterium]